LKLSSAFEKAQASIVNGEYIIGEPTRYFILTIKKNNHNYLVIIREGDATISKEESFDRLDAAKKLGVKVLTENRPDADVVNTTMVHYKGDRPNGIPWQKDSESVLQGLFEAVKHDPFKQVDRSKLNQILKSFTSYRQKNELEYLQQERNYKLEFFHTLGAILRQIDSTPAEAKDQLYELIRKKQSELAQIRWWDNLISAFSGYSQRDDFRVYMENIDVVEFREVFTSLFDEGITSEIRTRINNRFKELFDQGKMAPAKKSYSTPTVQFLAVFLASYAPDEYSLYKSTEYTNFAEAIGLSPDNDVIRKYEFFNQMAKFILRFSKENNYKVDDLIDVHNLIYLYDETNLHDELQGEKPSMSKSQNTILYGPPGTGKTYSVIQEALKILMPEIDPATFSDDSRREETVQLYKKFIESNQVMFCTFHQSFSYEDFVEGIRFNQDNNGYEVRDGVFKRICSAARASVVEQSKTYDFNPNDTNFFKMSLGYIYDTEDDIFNYCMEHNRVALGWGDDVDFSNCSNKQEIKGAFLKNYPEGKAFAIEAMERFKHWMQHGDIVVISGGNKWVRAIGKVTGDYNFDPDAYPGYMHFREVEWLFVDNENMLPVERILKEKIFSQQSIYMFGHEDLNMDSLLELIAGKRISGTEESQYVLIIDEINRGNISKIFGELITLVEPDKRMGRVNELSVTLPYSGQRLSVPSNVHLLGTMNTADRSIALLDTALRRRFDFKEMMPRYDLLPENVEGINVRKLLQTINDRIEYLYDRDHQIGHAYFMTKQPTANHVKEVMMSKVIPLLQEYFYENWESVELVLGGAGKHHDHDYLLTKTKLSPRGLFGKSDVADMGKYRYSVQANPSNKAFIRVYEPLPSAHSEERDDLE
jgi:hypothetical protein